MFRKLNASTEHDLEFLMLFNGNSFPNVTFFLKNPQKVIYRRVTFFYQKVRNLHFLCHLIWPRWFNFLVHECLNLTRFFFSVSYALCIQWKIKAMTKKWKKNPTYLATYPIFLEHVTPIAVPRHIFILFNQYL